MEQILRRELKRWQKSFKDKHGRDPTKRDILADASIAGTYDTWQALGGDSQQIEGKAKVRKTVPASNKSKHDKHARKGKAESSAAAVLKTPTKSKRFSTQHVDTSPSKNPFRTPTKSPVKKPNPFATPSKQSPIKAAPSPAGSVVDVSMTPPKAQYEESSSPSRLRSLVAAHSKHSNSPSRAAGKLDAALIAYTPRTKARKRLRGEDVPPTPRTNGRTSSDTFAARPDLRHAGTEPRPSLATHRPQGLGAFGFNTGPRPAMSASTGKLGTRSVTAPAASVFSRQLSSSQSNDAIQDHPMEDESPSKPKARLPRGSTDRREFTPLFASPSGNHGAVTVLPDFQPKTGLPRTTSTSSAGSADPSKGGLFAAELEKRRRQHDIASDDEDAGKRQKTRANLTLPSSSDDEEARDDFAISSPHTKSTAPTSSASRTDAPRPRAPLADRLANTQRLEVSDDEDDARRGGKKVITMLPYQRYGSLRENGAAASARLARGDDSDDDDEHMYGSYCLIPPKPAQDAISTGWGFDSDSDADELPSKSAATSASLAGLKLSPNKHGPSSSISRARQQKVLDTLFDPSASSFSAGGKHRQEFDPAARAGPIAADQHNSPDELDEQPSEHHTENDDDDWEQDVDEEYTFLDNEIELGDMV